MPIGPEEAGALTDPEQEYLYFLQRQTDSWLKDGYVESNPDWIGTIYLSQLTRDYRYTFSAGQTNRVLWAYKKVYEKVGTTEKWRVEINDEDQEGGIRLIFRKFTT